jgi:hypothetical protein
MDPVRSIRATKSFLVSKRIVGGGIGSNGIRELRRRDCRFM